MPAYVFMHDRVCLGKVLPMLGLSHKSVDLGMDTCQYGIGHTTMYVTLDYTFMYVRCITACA